MNLKNIMPEENTDASHLSNMSRTGKFIVAERD